MTETKKTCCYNCQERHFNCHSQCDRYQAQRKPFYKAPEDKPYQDYKWAKGLKIEHKKHIGKRR